MKPLTIDELKALKVGDWVWLVDYDNGSWYQQILTFPIDIHISKWHSLTEENYGVDWLAYKNKEQAEAKCEIVELPCKVGDTVYWVNNPHQKELISFVVEDISAKFVDGEWRWFVYNRFGYGGRYGSLDGWYLGKDKSEAELRLAELKGEKHD